MTQTWKDSERQSTHRTVLEATKNDDGTYQIVFNVVVIGSSIPEEWLEEELCANGDSAEKNLFRSNITSGVWTSSCNPLGGRGGPNVGRLSYNFS